MNIHLGTKLVKNSTFSHTQKRFLQRPALNQSQLPSGRRTGLLAMKVGMMSIYDKWAQRFPVTVLQVDSCHVVQIKTPDDSGYSALQLSVGEAKIKNVNKPLLGQYQKAGVLPGRKLMEFRVTPDSVIPIGTRLRALHFVPGQLLDVCGTSKGKGFAGAMKKWNFGGGRATHGNSLSHRIVGSTGCRQDPGKVFKGKKMPGRLGGERVTVQNLSLLKIDPLRDLLYVKGAVPGPTGSFVRVTDAVKGPFHPSPPPFPTFLLPESDPAFPKESLLAPASETDSLDFKEPDDPY